MCIDVLLYVWLCEGVRSPATGVTDGCELPCGCWLSTPGCLEEQPVLLTTEPCLQSPSPVLNIFECTLYTSMCVAALYTLEWNLYVYRFAALHASSVGKYYYVRECAPVWSPVSRESQLLGWDHSSEVKLQPTSPTAEIRGCPLLILLSEKKLRSPANVGTAWVLWDLVYHSPLRKFFTAIVISSIPSKLE